MGCQHHSQGLGRPGRGRPEPLFSAFLPHVLILSKLGFLCLPVASATCNLWPLRGFNLSWRPHQPRPDSKKLLFQVPTER